MNTPIASGGHGSALPGKRKRTRKPGPNRNSEQAVQIVVRADGSFVPDGPAARKLCRDRGLRTGMKLIGYLYQPADEEQWAQMHAFGTKLVEYIPDYSELNSHEALKKCQRDGRIACDIRDIPGTDLQIVEAESLAWGWMDQTRRTQVFREMCAYITRRYFGHLGPEAEGEITKLMIREPEAAA